MVTVTRKPAPHETRVLIAADEPLEGRALKLLLESAGYEALYVESLPRARRMLGAHMTEVVLWVGERLEATAAADALELRREHAEAGLCMLAHGADPDRLRDLLSENAEGLAFLHRARLPGVPELLDAIGAAASRRSALEPSLVERLVTDAHASGHALEWLSESEHEVLELVAEGLRNEAIARRLCKSEKTIEKRVTQVLAKLGLDAATNPDLDRRVAAARIFLGAYSRQRGGSA